MAKELVYINRQDLTDAADAIRERLNTTDKYTTSMFADAVRAIQGGSSGEAEAPTISVSSSGLITASVNGLSATQQLNTQAAKTVTPSTSQQTAVASGVYTTGAVTVAAIPTATLATPTINVSSTGLITATETQANAGYIAANTTKTATQQLSTQAAAGITPTKSAQTAVAAGKYTTGAVMVNPIPDEYIIPSGSQTLTQNKTYDVTSLESVTVNVSGGGTTPTGTLEINNNGVFDVTDVASADVLVPPLVYTSSKSGSGTTSIVFNGLPAEPVVWSLCSNTATATTAATYGIVDAYYDGSSYSGLTVYESRSNQQSRTYTPTITATYSGGTLTIRASGSSTAAGTFQNTRTYNLMAICWNQGGTDVIVRDANSDEPISDQETFTY